MIFKGSFFCYDRFKSIKIRAFSIVFIYVPLLQVKSLTHRYLATLETENALRRSRIEAEIAASRAATEAVLRSRIEAEANAEKVYKDEVLRRSRVQAE